MSNYAGVSGSQGTVAVYQAKESPPAIFSDPNFQRFLWCAYDNMGNLFADGGSENVIDEVPKGSGSISEVKLSKSIITGSMQWANNALLIAEIVNSRGDNPIYQVDVTGSTGNVSGPVLLSSTNGRAAIGDVQFWLEGKTMVGPGHAAGNNSLLQFWNYPRGGLPTKTIRYRKKRSYFGVTVSVAS